MKKVNTNKENLKVNIAFVSLVTCVIILAIFCYSLYFDQKECISKSNIYRKLLSLSSETQSNEAIEKGKEYFGDAVSSYQLKKFIDVQTNCQLARQQFADANGILRQLNVQIREENAQVFVIYSQIINTSIVMYDDLSEACEHFETASKYYEQYIINGNPLDEDMAIKEIESMNKNIENHDETASTYNDLLAEYKLEVNKLLQ